MSAHNVMHGYCKKEIDATNKQEQEMLLIDVRIGQNSKGDTWEKDLGC